MKRFLKWLGITVLVVAVLGFLAFLYFIPPFMLMKPEEFSGPAGKAGPDLSTISDPAERAIAERGHYLVTIGSCADCHATPGAQGPRIDDMYLAGGFKGTRRNFGTYVSMNLTPDKATGVGGWSDDDIKRVLRNGLAPDGRQVPGHLMPWPGFSHWTDEDMHAVVVYLRHTVPIVHSIPKPASATLSDPAAYEEDYAGADYAAPQK
jgi:Cytochrome C oxidase, cbb3-type, subunit III